MVSRATQSEMRIGLNTSAFGNVEVRTLVHANDVGVVIGSEKGDLHALLATEIPGIANTLQQQNLRLQQVNFHQGFTFSGNLGSGADSQSRYPASAARGVSFPGLESGSEPPDDKPAGGADWIGSSGLNILA